MTPEYKQIELDENTPEPTADGIYLLTTTMGDETRTYPATKEGDMWLTDDYYTWKDLLSEMSQADRVTIQSLAAHDAQIRAEALEFTNEERDLMLKSALDFTETDDAQEVDEMIAAIIGSVAEHRNEQK